LTKIGLSKGSLVTARVVKHIIGKGVTVQLSHNKEQHQFGFLPTCEITDDLSGNAVKYISDKSVFAARIIDFDAKGGKPVVSARESVVEEEGWKTIQPTGSSAAFQLADEQRMATGNLRNKILKYGADVALSRGDLAIGYVTNIGKAGCFVQIGHNCSVRAGLNELSDSASFDFATEFPVGRLVVGRIAKVEDTASGQKRFSYSTRQSLVVYGVGCVDRAKLAESDEVEALVMAVAEEKAFAQIKGSYIKLKVKNFPPKSLKAGDQIVASLTKVTKEKLSSTFVKKISKSDEITPE
jgi:ribosomal protein S1